MLAVLSRLHPEWFPPTSSAGSCPGIEIERRLAYPLNYSSALGSFAAMALPLLLAVSSWRAPRRPGCRRRGASRSPGSPSISPPRARRPWSWWRASSSSFCSLPTACRSWDAGDRCRRHGDPRLRGRSPCRARPRDPDAEAKSQGDEVLLILIAVCAAVALCQLGISLAVRHGRRRRWLLISPRAAAVATVAILVAMPIAVAAGAPREAKDRWENFKSRECGAGRTASRSSQILNTSGSGRYQFWQSAVDAYKTEKFHGIGPGTFEFWWAQHATYAGAFVSDAHSLYIETLAELGIVGFILVAALVLGILGIGTVRSLRAPPDLRLGLAAATAGCVAFAVAAGLDYIWEIGVMPITFFLLAAVAVDAGRAGNRVLARRTQQRRWRDRLAGWHRARRDRRAGRDLPALQGRDGPPRQRARRQAQGRLDAALSEARSAADAQPYAASPRLQEALVLERQGKFDGAAAAAREATMKESTNWRTFFVLSRIEAERGNAKASLAAYRRAQQLNPHSGVFAP